MNGKKTKARVDYMCQACGSIIKAGTYYDYADGWSATYKNDIGESERKYYQFRTHLDNECDENSDLSFDEFEDKYKDFNFNL
jgi:hypothetical protein